MVKSLLGWGIGESIMEMVEAVLAIIPKTVYFMYAALASALDALQGLMRRLAGLDGYYVGGNGMYESGSEVAGDPVLEFIYGILGIGKRAGQYSALTTTFWSLAIFGIIVLAVGTMIAIIRAHYQEDSAKTSPISYIYNAFKAILTFAIVPFAVIIGIKLSSFLLTTLDDITAGSATTEAVTGIYGSNQVGQSNGNDRNKLLPNKDGGFTNYDFFGAGAPANTTTFSGMLFKTAAYEANRARLGSIVLVGDKQLVAKKGDDKNSPFLNNIIFGDTSAAGFVTAQDKNAYLAYQFDYAFANNLRLGGIWHVAQFAPRVSGANLGNLDPFGALAGFSSFSKYNVGLVWVFYDLWRFNFIIGFGAVFTCFGMFLSIIIGLMSRLIKSIALFLIYPATLGLASLDEFGAFKKWRVEFMKQILAAFGSIIGMNIFFLIFPYLNTITFYQNTLLYALLNQMVTTVVIITGLLVTKNFIEFVSGLVGGANAMSEGEGLKGQVGKTFMSGMKATAGGFALANKINPLTQLAWNGIGKRKGIKQMAANAWAKKDIKKADKLKGKADELEKGIKFGKANKKVADAEELIKTRKAELDNKMETNQPTKREFNKLKNKYSRQGLSEEEAIQKAKQDIYSKDSKIQKAQETIDSKGLSKTDYEKVQEADKLRAKSENLSNRAKGIREATYLEEDGSKTKRSAKAQYANFGRDLAGAFFKNFASALGEMKINVGALKGLFYAGSNKTVDEKGQVTGETLAINPWDPSKRVDDSGKPRDSIGSLFAQSFGGNRTREKKKSVDEIQEKAAKDQAASAKAIEKAVEKIVASSEKMSKSQEKIQETFNKMSGIIKKDK